jgi:hypothetical protein
MGAGGRGSRRVLVRVQRRRSAPIGQYSPSSGGGAGARVTAAIYAQGYGA